jgi:ubiquinone/menaquinone biosynthesis C-methylase UbiE
MINNPLEQVPDTSKERERAFHDELYAQSSWEQGPRAATLKYYSAVKHNRQHFRDLVAQYGAGKSILEIGCGDGGYAFDFAPTAKRVCGIDISDVGVEAARRKAEELGLHNMEFHVMEVEAMDYPDATFDVVYGSGILHHLNLDRSCREIVRVLKPTGVAIFTEPLAHNPLINLYRRMTPNMRSANCHPLRLNQLRTVEDYFAKNEMTFHNLLSIGAVPFRSFSNFDKILSRFEQFDDALFRMVPYLRRHAWMTVFVLSQPRLSKAK